MLRHIHALGQCRKIIRKHKWKPVVAGDTAGAARMVAEEGERSIAALAPRLAAELYGLDILEENVEDPENNVTRFVVLSKEKQWAAQDAGRLLMTTFVFRVRNIPAALYKAMGGFATNGVNMTKLESYQLGGKFYATQFYADIEGHPDDAPVKRALEELAYLLARHADRRRLPGPRLPRGRAREDRPGGVVSLPPRPVSGKTRSPSRAGI